jgi:hypothetical protein
MKQTHKYELQQSLQTLNALILCSDSQLSHPSAHLKKKNHKSLHLRNYNNKKKVIMLITTSLVAIALSLMVEYNYVLFIIEVGSKGTQNGVKQR